ncbi:MAG: molybdopterin molybdotransferase MoeA [Coriobacteriales bacterium]|jgi:molybdopterin molybdotransferase
MSKKKMSGFPTQEQALADFFESWKPTPEQTATELVSLDDSIDRILSEDIISKYNLPLVRSSGMDGIAVRSSDFADGIPNTAEWVKGKDYVRADTGDDFPDEFDSVIAIEDVTELEGGGLSLDLDEPVTPGCNVNPSGSRIRSGETVLKAGIRIRPTDITVLCMAGATMVPVRRKPKIAFIPTGSELVTSGTEPLRGQNIDTNSLMVKHMLIEYGAEPVVFPIIRDNPAELERALDTAVASCDCVVINGGSAVGSEDFNVRLMEKRGKVVHHYISAVPGRPMMMAVIDGKPIVDLPGPTLAAFFGTTWCLKKIVSRFLGTTPRENQKVRALAKNGTGAPKNFAKLTRVQLTKSESGYEAEFIPRKAGLADCMASNAMHVSPVGESGVEAGSVVEVELLRSESEI